jgi:nitrite reductase/ring-hydroxylating ferredoxin subunit
MTDAVFVPLMSLAEIRKGSMQTRVVEGREIVLCHTREGLFALDNICTHAHARMCEGRLRATRLVCPLHGASFDIRDGRVLTPPATVPLATHQVRVVNGTIEISLSPAPEAQAGVPAR